MPTMEQEDPDIEWTARDVLDEDELADYCRNQGGRPWDRANKEKVHGDPQP